MAYPHISSSKNRLLHDDIILLQFSKDQIPSGFCLIGQIRAFVI